MADSELFQKLFAGKKQNLGFIGTSCKLYPGSDSVSG